MLKDHYLEEDYELLTDELDKLHRTCMNVLNDAAEANFENTKIHLQQINKSMTLLQALNNKKLKRDEFELHNFLLYQRRGWTK